jgi:hypothetical protein
VVVDFVVVVADFVVKVDVLLLLLLLLLLGSVVGIFSFHMFLLVATAVLLFDLSCKSQTLGCCTRITQILSGASGPTIQKQTGKTSNSQLKNIVFHSLYFERLIKQCQQNKNKL